MVFSLRSFRAINDPESCQKFLDGHERVLLSIGIKQVTSSTAEWTKNPDVYVFIVESEDGSEVYGGGRIHVANDEYELPIEKAVGFLDSDIHKLIHDKKNNGGAAELCGLWNSRKVAGMGFGAVYLARVGVAILDSINVNYLFSLCAPYTINMGLLLGFEIEKTLGKEGTFYYPKDDLLATVLIHKDPLTMSKATNEEKEAVLYLRNNPIITRNEIHRDKAIKINYHLEIK